MNTREERFRPATGGDPRKPFQRDRDRVLYCPEFRRLSGVTQVASATEGDVFHNRLTHSLKVAQVGRRLAERLLGDSSSEVVAGWGGLDPDVVETAGLAHDLGHPPFGHHGEEVIREAVDQAQGEKGTSTQAEESDGFEGNAQSFRIVTRLAAHMDSDRDQEYAGLNLTRATLNAILKYPWYRGEAEERPTKWSAYRADAELFMWVRQMNGASPAGSPEQRRSLEAELMDWADDVTYAVHDLEDFYRAGLIPIHRLRAGTELDRFIAEAGKRPHLSNRSDDLANVLRASLGVMVQLDTPYDGGRHQRRIVNQATSALISQFVSADAIRINPPSEEVGIYIHPDVRLQVDLLKEVTRYYVIDHPRIAGVREGQREMLRRLFGIYVDVVEGSRSRALLPKAIHDRSNSGDGAPRLVADFLAGMTERQVIQTHHRLTGITPGPISYFDL